MSIGFDGFGSVFFDGDRPVTQEVSLHLANQNLQIGLDDGNVVFWPIKDIRRLPDQAGKKGFVLRLATDPLARLYLTDTALLGHLPHARRASLHKGRGKLLFWAAAAIVAVAVQITVLVPLLADRLALYIPPSGERALGAATLQQIRQALDETGLQPLPLCENPNGIAALDQIAQALDSDGSGIGDVTVFVLDHPMVNAFALPGGYVVLFSGLIDEAASADEIAAVFAHEIGHVASRDPTRHALRSAGSIGVLGLLFGDFAGGAAVLMLAEQLISAKYSRAAETAADQFGYDMLEQAGVSPAAMGAMFERLRDENGDEDAVLAHFLSHPTLSKRIEDAQSAASTDKEYTPILSDPAWRALQDICS